MKVYIEGYGCVLNQADTDIIKNSLIKEGFTIVDNLEEADIVIINTCIVRLETENRMIYRIKKFKNMNKFVVVAGCLPKALKEKINNLPYILPKEAFKAGEILKNYLKNENIEHNDENLNKELYKKLYLLEPKLITPLPIAEGCLGKCSFCIVRLARGSLKSYPREILVERVKYILNKGAKCLFITAQDTACYGFDRGDNLANLLNDLSSIDKEFIMRVGMMHPKSLMNVVDEVIESYKSEKVGKFLHLPLQSGDNEILKLMNRGYTVDEFIELVKEFRKKIKDLCFVTDIIVGFPTETDEQFNNTLEVLKKIKPDYIHAAKYTVRKKTPAAKMKQVDSKIKKERSRILDKLRRELSYKQNKKYIGKTLKCLIVDKNKAYLDNFKVVKVDCEDIGEFKKVKITNAKTFGLLGKII
ncbi:tRNA (N(6)-L-threonylcarbamoyladenosine(37)-C(2))-methylthiotransferase [Methanocaldococcus indicus]|uniref:tRNA (N(6)-L-threonylcarbamoyladenosine(37)-C(2))- methylthiotransferase n=1 Tax=Methanocaldococcus indicus TaxID=213231 RepID=UPI003C6D7D67